MVFIQYQELQTKTFLMIGLVFNNKINGSYQGFKSKFRFEWSNDVTFTYASHALIIELTSADNPNDKYLISFYSNQRKIEFTKNNEVIWIM